MKLELEIADDFRDSLIKADLLKSILLVQEDLIECIETEESVNVYSYNFEEEKDYLEDLYNSLIRTYEYYGGSYESILKK